MTMSTGRIVEAWLTFPIVFISRLTTLQIINKLATTTGRWPYRRTENLRALLVITTILTDLFILYGWLCTSNKEFESKNGTLYDDVVREFCDWAQSVSFVSLVRARKSFLVRTGTRIMLFSKGQLLESIGSPAKIGRHVCNNVDSARRRRRYKTRYQCIQWRWPVTS